MKKLVLNSVLPFVLGLTAIIIIGSGCYASPPNHEGLPSIYVYSPNEDDIFYTENGVDQPNSLQISSKSDSNHANIAHTTITIYNSLNDIVFSFEDYSAEAEIDKIFYTAIPGLYEVVFESTDEVGKSTTVARNVTCVLSESDVETDN